MEGVSEEEREGERDGGAGRKGDGQKDSRQAGVGS